MLLEAISSFFEYCVGRFDGAWLLIYSLLLELHWKYCTSCFSCLKFCFVDEFDLDGAFALVFFMFSDLSICMVSCLLGWILVSLDFLLISFTSFAF